VIAGYAYTITGSRDEAENIIQEVFLAVIRRIDSLRPEGNFRAYLLIKARGLALNLRRIKKPEDCDSLDTAAVAPGPAQIAETAEASKRTSAALASLPPEQREIVALRAHAGMTVNEIAEMLKEPVGTIKSRYRYALQKLRALLAEEEI
jgi:RNA polymerase sigma-70 factor (ECF subfamily)